MADQSHQFEPNQQMRQEWNTLREMNLSFERFAIALPNELCFAITEYIESNLRERDGEFALSAAQKERCKTLSGIDGLLEELLAANPNWLPQLYNIFSALGEVFLNPYALEVDPGLPLDKIFLGLAWDSAVVEKLKSDRRFFDCEALVEGTLQTDQELEIISQIFCLRHDSHLCRLHQIMDSAFEQREEYAISQIRRYLKENGAAALGGEWFGYHLVSATITFARASNEQEIIDLALNLIDRYFLVRADHQSFEAFGGISRATSLVMRELVLANSVGKSGRLDDYKALLDKFQSAELPESNIKRAARFACNFEIFNLANFFKMTDLERRPFVSIFNRAREIVVEDSVALAPFIGVDLAATPIAPDAVCDVDPVEIIADSILNALDIERYKLILDFLFDDNEQRVKWLSDVFTSAQRKLNDYSRLARYAFEEYGDDPLIIDLLSTFQLKTDPEHRMNVPWPTQAELEAVSGNFSRVENDQGVLLNEVDLGTIAALARYGRAAEVLELIPNQSNRESQNNMLKELMTGIKDATIPLVAQDFTPLRLPSPEQDARSSRNSSDWLMELKYSVNIIKLTEDVHDDDDIKLKGLVAKAETRAVQIAREYLFNNQGSDTPDLIEAYKVLLDWRRFPDPLLSEVGNLLAHRISSSSDLLSNPHGPLILSDLAVKIWKNRVGNKPVE